jgi:FdhD protein
VTTSSGLAKTSVSRVEGLSDLQESIDLLAVEEPLEIRLGLPGGGHKAISITMRTPGNDAELAAGFLFSEGIISSPDQIKQIKYCGKLGVPALAGSSVDDRPAKAGTPNGNTIRVDLQKDVDIDLKRLERHFYTTSSCGVCGKSSIDALATGVTKLSQNGFTVGRCLLNRLPELLRRSQDIFDKTGGLHASALFATEGTLDIVREDVGRHNALDKVIGAKFLAGEMPISDRILLVSGRASFELVQKALMAGIPIMAAVGAPSSLAVELAREYGMTLAGFLRDERFNVYCGAERVRQKHER